ncbi:iron-sulfur cluster-binding domain-containing protein [Pseudovibrio sp. Tun.PSC04-5.I4]|uniref:flavin reductase family protein n=1 Tax=Pseudovibrio sp. Tun.PSC04-5.I4 TaxID=1798213 RepID=UPI000A740882|nr:iron-sulfur cluster-binding domain-containing protein [Pseudovibrio sp. Tun.PSC04-5.I4]
MIEEAEERGDGWHLHTCFMTNKDAPFVAQLLASHPNNVCAYFANGEENRRLNIPCFMSQLEHDAHIYTCGPTPMMRAVRGTGAELPSEVLHFECFGSTKDSNETAFEVQLNSSGKVIPIAANKTILQALQDADIQISSESGICGTCRTGYIAGDVDHRDYVLNLDQREKCLMACVARSKGRIVLDL